MRLYPLIRPLLFRLPPEPAHHAFNRIGRTVARTPLIGAIRSRYAVTDDRLTVDAFGHTFPNPVGVAAGFDKNAMMPGLLAALGFGHVEIGGVTARPQAGNSRPRLFRLPEDEALINRMGFNNDGADRIGARLQRTKDINVPLGVNIGLSKGVPDADAPADYRYTYERVAHAGDFFVVNVSSPNTPGLRNLQGRDRLTAIVSALQNVGAEPLLIKLSPDLHRDAMRDAIEVVNENGLDGVIAVNTTLERPTSLTSPHQAESGGLSGRPLTEPATQVVSIIADQTDVPIIGVGGIFTAADAYERIRAGATLVQLYTGLIYRGPGIAADINRGLGELLERDGFDSVTDAVGADLD